MRSHLVYLAKAQVPNYFLLIHLTAKATRAFHKPNNCIGKTINQALERIAAQGEREGIKVRTVNISGLSRAAVLAALYNASRPLGLGFMHYDKTPMTEEEAEAILQKQTYFDYLKGRVMKLSIDSDEIGVDMYNRDNGPNAAEFVVDELRKTGASHTPAIESVHVAGKEQAASIARKDMGIDSKMESGVMTLGLADMKEDLAPKIDEALR